MNSHPDELLEAFALDALEDDEYLQVEQHLDSCARCRGYVAQLHQAASYNAERGRPKAWVMSVAHHKIVDIIRSRRRNIAMAHPTDYETLESLPSGQRATDEQAITNLEGERIRKALAVLPPAQREVIDLAYYHGFSQSEIARKLDQPLGTVKTRVRLAMRKLRVELVEVEENVGNRTYHAQPSG